MKFVLISRHADGAEVPEHERAQNLEDMTQWITLLKAEVAIPTRGGKSVTARRVDEYRGDIGGLIIFEADSLDHAVALARRSPGLKFGFTHDVLPGVSMEQASQEDVKGS